MAIRGKKEKSQKMGRSDNFGVKHRKHEGGPASSKRRTLKMQLKQMQENLENPDGTK